MESRQSNGSNVDQHYAMLQATLTNLVVARRQYHQAKYELESSCRAGLASSQRASILKCNYTDRLNAFTKRWEEFAAAMAEDQKFYPNNRSDFSFVSDIKDEKDQALNADAVCQQTAADRSRPHDAQADKDLTTHHPSSESSLAKETSIEDQKARSKSQRAADGNTNTVIHFLDHANTITPYHYIRGMTITSNPIDTMSPPSNQILIRKWYPKYEVLSTCVALRQSTPLLCWLAFALQAVVSVVCGALLQVRGTIWLLPGLLILHGLASGLYLLVRVLLQLLKGSGEARCRCLQPLIASDEERCRCLQPLIASGEPQCRCLLLLKASSESGCRLLQWVFSATYALVSASVAFAVVARSNAFSLETNLQICVALTCCVAAFQALLIAYHTINNHNIQDRTNAFKGSHQNV